MPHGPYSLGETAAKQRMVRLVCDKCGRRGQYRLDRLIEQYGPDIALPDLRHELAQCPHRRDMSDPCQVKKLIDWRIFEEDLRNLWIRQLGLTSHALQCHDGYCVQFIAAVAIF